MAAILSALNQATDEDFVRLQTLPNNRTLDHYHGITVVHDPNINIDNDEERPALAELRGSTQAAPESTCLDLDIVNKRLLDFSNGTTPERRPQPQLQPLSGETTCPQTPLEGEGLLQFYRTEEEGFRRQLIESGCPPCHPPEFTFPYDTEERQPESHPAAMFYIITNGNSLQHPLSHQMDDWTRFQRFQQVMRKDMENDNDGGLAKEFQQYISNRQWLLNKYNFAESASLIDWSIDLAEQSRLQTWLEYQAHEVHKHHKMEATARQIIGSASDRALEEASQNYEERRIVAHLAMLDWIEQHRVALSVAEAGNTSFTTTKGTLSPDVATAVASTMASRRRSERVQNRAAAKAAANSRSTTQRTGRQPHGRPKGLPAKKRPQKQLVTKEPVYTRSGRLKQQPNRLGWS